MPSSWLVTNSGTETLRSAPSARGWVSAISWSCSLCSVTQEGDGPLGQPPQKSPPWSSQRGLGCTWHCVAAFLQASESSCLVPLLPQTPRSRATHSPRVGAPSSEPKRPSLRVFTTQCRALVVWAIWRECPKQGSVNTCPRAGLPRGHLLPR